MTEITGPVFGSGTTRYRKHSECEEEEQGVAAFAHLHLTFDLSHRRMFSLRNWAIRLIQDSKAKKFEWAATLQQGEDKGEMKWLSNVHCHPTTQS